MPESKQETQYMPLTPETDYHSVHQVPAGHNIRATHSLVDQLIKIHDSPMNQINPIGLDAANVSQTPSQQSDEAVIGASVHRLALGGINEAPFLRRLLHFHTPRIPVFGLDPGGVTLVVVARVHEGLDDIGLLARREHAAVWDFAVHVQHLLGHDLGWA
jgi:hypothetical protein